MHWESDTCLVEMNGQTPDLAVGLDANQKRDVQAGKPAGSEGPPGTITL